MSTRTTHNGKLRSLGGRRRSDVAPGVTLMTMFVSGDPTAVAGTDAANARIGQSATSGPLAILPKGALPLRIYPRGGATGGSTPTVDVGLTINGTNDPDGVRNELDADSINNSGVDCIGAQMTTSTHQFGITHDSQITVSVGASAATGGTTSFVLVYALYDDGTAGEQSEF